MRVRVKHPRQLLALDALYGPEHRRGDERGVELGDLLSPFASSRWWVGAQPQRDVGGLHRLSYHPYQIVVQRVQARTPTSSLKAAEDWFVWEATI